MTAPRSKGRLWRGATLALAAGLTVALTQATTSAAFTAQTGDGGNQVTAAANFCTAGGTTLVPTADTTGYMQSPSTTYGANTDLGVGSGVGANGRLLVKFTLPALPATCALTGATLRLYAHTPVTGRTIDAYRVDPAAPAWSEASTTWSNLPATTGAAVGSASLASAGWQQWTVTAIVTSLYAGTNSGFLLRDRTEHSPSTVWQLYAARENATVANRPQLVLTWG